MDLKDAGFDTKLIHAGEIEDQFGNATVPIDQTSTFRFKSAQHGADCFSGASDGYIYTRIGNPTIHALEQNIAALENGYGGIATGSGMGAITTVYMALLNGGDHIISTDAVYGPANPTMEITDISACVKIARENNLVLVVDNTFCTPYLQKPLDLGADVVLHSVTKFINGHADIVGGIIVTKDTLSTVNR